MCRELCAYVQAADLDVTLTLKRLGLSISDIFYQSHFVFTCIGMIEITDHSIQYFLSLPLNDLCCIL